ncbi:transcription repressor NadR [Alkalibacter rhizosphaerae]|uniref:Transcription repressor NadR n=1 Tax=Alkalibacter rhizosphaerae TaxID=2815577 RepID=A0A975AIY9_9FIRM|nr:transcription repressor NadR [Alkalibacter rhizosphaerae]QSX09608.1 transcription repressor NadR [Alkalibacter rhizosphaerae]
MNSQERRKKLMENLKRVNAAVSGNELAALFGVSRQVIVQDIALLRAEGNDIVATARGYLYPHRSTDAIVKTIAVKHKSESMGEELYTIVEFGAKILDITVEHPIYGEIKGNLMLSTRQEVDDFVRDFQASGASPLSVVTNGVHLHSIEVPSMKIFELIQTALREKDFLLEN